MGKKTLYQTKKRVHVEMEMKMNCDGGSRTIFRVSERVRSCCTEQQRKKSKATSPYILHRIWNSLQKVHIIKLRAAIHSGLCTHLLLLLVFETQMQRL